MIEIYRKINKEETPVASVPDDNATLERTLMGADEVTLSVTVSEPLDLRVGDYARLEGSSSVSYTHLTLPTMGRV